MRRRVKLESIHNEPSIPVVPEEEPLQFLEKLSVSSELKLKLSKALKTRGYENPKKTVIRLKGSLVSELMDVFTSVMPKDCKETWHKLVEIYQKESLK